MVQTLQQLIDAQQELSQSLGGRAQLFQRSLANDPTFGNITPIARRGRERQFDPFSAAFSLNQLQNPSNISGGNFADFLNSAPSSLNRGGFNQAFTNLASSLFGQGGTGGLPEGDPGSARSFIQDQEPTAENIIGQFASSGINPLFRGAARRGVQSSIDAFRANNTSSGIFEEFLRNGFGGFGGGFLT